MIDCELFKNSDLIRIKVRGMGGNVRKVPVTRDAVVSMLNGQLDGLGEEEREKRIGEALAKLKASTTLITCDALTAISEFQTGFKTSITKRYCNRAYFDEGFFLVSKSVVGSLREEFEEAKEKLGDKLIPAFIAVYPDELAKAKKLWGEKACASLPAADEADRLLGAFDVDYRLTQLSVPEGLPPEIRAEEEEKLRKAFADAQSAITGALWAEFSGFLGKIQDRLTVSEDGKKKIFRDTLFEDLTVFIGSFVNRNAFNDARLQGLVAQAQAILGKVGGKDVAESAQRMRDFEGLRGQTAKAFAALAEETTKAIAEEPSRSFKFEE